MFSFKSTILRVAGALLFIGGGSGLILMSATGAAPSLWYFLCYCALPVVGFVWIWRPSLAAGFGIGPLISIVALLQDVSGMWAFSRVWAATVVVGLATAAILTAVALRGFHSWRLPVILSLAFVSISFAADRLFTNKTTVRSHQMYVALNGHVPWGEVGPEWSDGSAALVLYRRVGTSYCYDAFQSEELRRRLESKDGHPVTVEYNIFSDFGKERGYNVRSVDGLLLAIGQHTVRDFERFGGQVLENGASSLDNCR